MPEFSSFEKRMLKYFACGTEITYLGDKLKVIESDKPTCSKGEPKTDIYILAGNENTQKEIKISYKKQNADFLENKTTAERAEQLFGKDWRKIIERSTLKIKERFEERPRIYKEGFKRTEKGSITLGWKFEILNKPSGDLSGKIDLDIKQVYDVYAGTNLSTDKKNAFVNNRAVRNSGIAEYILISDNACSAQDVIDLMIPIGSYVNHHPELYFACKALNYRTFKQKYDGNRPLAVQVKWEVEKGKLVSDLCFHSPLECNGREMASGLIRCMKSLNIKTTDDIDENNTDISKAFE